MESRPIPCRLPQLLQPLPGVIDLVGLYRSIDQQEDGFFIIRRLIDHPSFQRLRLVPQLLLVKTVYPGGTHTRFEHAIGAYDLARRYIVRLLDNAVFRVEFRRNALEETLIAVLLSNLDGFALDHALFEIMPTLASGKFRESRLWSLLNRRASERDGRWAALGEAIRQVFPEVDLQRVVRLVALETTPDTPARATLSLIRSSLDVRVVDYIRRDARHTGIPVGEGIDVDDLIDNLVLIHKSGRIGISQRGVNTVENLLCARYWAFSRVYWSPRNRAMTAMLKFALYALTVKGRVDYTKLVGGILFQDEPAILDLLGRLWRTHAAPGYRRSHLLSLLNRARPLSYVPALDVNRATLGIEAFGRLETLSYSRLERLRLGLTDRLKRRLGVRLEMDSILLDFPVQRAPKLGEDIEVLFDDNTVRPLRQVSGLVRSLPNAFRDSAKRLRVFVAPDVPARIKSLDFRGQVLKELQRILQ